MIYNNMPGQNNMSKEKLLNSIYQYTVGGDGLKKKELQAYLIREYNLESKPMWYTQSIRLVKNELNKSPRSLKDFTEIFSKGQQWFYESYLVDGRESDVIAAMFPNLDVKELFSCDADLSAFVEKTADSIMNEVTNTVPKPKSSRGRTTTTVLGKLKKKGYDIAKNVNLDDALIALLLEHGFIVPLPADAPADALAPDLA